MDDALALVDAALTAAHNPRLGTDTRLQHALRAIDYLVKWAQYHDRMRAFDEARREAVGR